MASTYANDLRIELQTTGENSGSWGTRLNSALTQTAEALSYGTKDCFATDADQTITVPDGTADASRALYLKVTSSATLTATRTMTIGPNTISRLMFIENATTGSQSITISQGTGASVTIATSKTTVVYFDGAGAAAAVVDALALVDPGVTDTLAEVLVAGNATGGTDIATTTTDKVQFRDAAIYINSSTDGQLDIVADTEIQLAATTVDLNGNLDVSGTALVTGVLTTTATQVATGGITSGSDIISDTNSTDSLGSTGVRWLKGWFDTLTAGTLTIGSGSVTDSSGAISFGDENLTTTGIVTAAGTSVFTNLDISGDVDIDGTLNVDAIDIDGALQLDGALTVGVDGTGYDVKFFGDTSGKSLLWDESADSLIVTGTIDATTVEFDSLSGTGAVAVTNILDEDNLSSDSATALSTQQSIKAYVDAQVGTVDTLAEVLANGNTTGGTDIATTTTDKVQFRDSAIYINSSTDGQLDIVADTEVQIAATTVDLNGNLDVSGTALVTGVLTTTATQVATGGITSGSDIISDTNSTDSLGSTGVRWLKGWFDTLTAGTLTIGPGSVTDSSGAISFGDENLTTTGIVTAAGTSVFTNLDISGDVDIDGTLNVDAIDIDGALQLDGALTVGVDGTGYDVKFFGDTSGAYMLWDESADDLKLVGAAGLTVAGDIDVDGTTNLDVVDIDGATQADGTITVGADGTGYDVKFFGDTSGAYMLWDESADDLKLVGAAGLTVAGDIDVDGTTNLDIVDIDGLLTASAAIEINGAAGAGISEGMLIDWSTNLARFLTYDSSTGSEIAFYTQPSGGSTTERIRIKEDGGFVITPAAGGHAVFNEGGLDADFRVESSGNANMLFVDGGNNSVNIGTTNSSGYTLNVAGLTQVQNQLDVVSTGGANLTQGDIMIKSSTADTPSVRGQGVFMFNEGADQTWYAGTGYNAGSHYHIGFAASASASKEGARVTNGVLHLYNNATGAVFNENGADRDFRVESSGNASMLHVDGGDNRVGIGTASPSALLGLNASAPDFTMLQSDSVKFRMGVSNTTNGGSAGSASGDFFARTAGGKMFFSTDDGVTSAMVIDASDNVLVGKTSANNSSVGVEASAAALNATVSGDTVARLNRLSDDGEILRFQKGTSTVGSIGSEGGDSLVVEGGTTSGSGLHFHATTSDIAPARNGARIDNTIDLGSSSNRFKDLHLSGGVVFGATGGSVSSKTLDDYEEGTWTPVLSDGTNNATTNANGWTHGTYVKVGTMVWLQCTMNTSSLGSVSGAIRITGLPFTSVATYINPIFVFGSQMNLTAQDSVTGRIIYGESCMHLATWDGADGASSMQETEWSDDGYANISAMYRAA